MLCAYLFVLGVGAKAKRMSPGDKLAALKRGDSVSSCSSASSSASETQATESFDDASVPKCDGISPSPLATPPLAKPKALPNLVRARSSNQLDQPEESQLDQPDPGVSAPTSSKPDPGVSAPTSSTISSKAPPLARPKQKSGLSFKLRELKRDDPMLKIFKRFCGKLRKDRL